MRNQTQQGILVGFFFILGAVIMFGTYQYLAGRLNASKHITVVFDNARGIKPGESIQMSGVDIGQVEDVSLRPDNQAGVRIRVGRKYRIPEGSRFSIQTGILGNQRFFTVDPNTSATTEIPDEAIIVGQSNSPLDENLTEAKKLVVQGQKLVASFQKISDRLDDPRIVRRIETTLDNTAQTTENLKLATARLPELQVKVDMLIADLHGTLASGRRIAKNAEGLTGQMEKLAADARGIAKDVGKLTRDVDSTVMENKETIKNALSGLEEATGAVASILTDLKGTLTDTKLKEKLGTATDNLVSVSARLDAAADDLQRLTGDPRLAADLRETLSNIKETSASIRNLTGRLETIRIPGEKRPTTGEPQKPRPPSATSLVEPGFVFDGSYDTTLERLRVDTNYTRLYGRPGGFFRLGIQDFAETNKLNAQIGRALNDPMATAYRYGLFSGKLGVGGDLRLGPLDFRLDLYDPNRFQADARIKTYIDKNTAFTFGIGSIGKDNRATIGVQFRR